MTEAPFIFRPSTTQGEQWRHHASRCTHCVQNGRVSGARCDEGKALRDAYIQSLGEQRGGRDYRAEMLKAWGPVQPFSFPTPIPKRPLVEAGTDREWLDG